MDYLVTMTTHVPEGTPEHAVDDIRAHEAAHSSDLAAQGTLLRLWRPPLQPGEWRSLGLFAAQDAAELEDVPRRHAAAGVAYRRGHTAVPAPE
jgi:muconolactone D-isomerase